MFCRRRLEMNLTTTDGLQTLIRRETLAENVEAGKLLQSAKVRADELLQHTAVECKHQRKQDSIKFWTMANGQLSAWENERKMLCDSLETIGTKVVNQAIKQLLDEIVPERRLAVLLRQLLLNQLPTVNATLLCHPMDHEQLEALFSLHQLAQWRLETDKSVSRQALVLETEEGSFHLNWTSMVEALPGFSKSPTSQA